MDLGGTLGSEIHLTLEGLEDRAGPARRPPIGPGVAVPRDGPYGVAVDTKHIYRSDFERNRIGRARLNGTRVDRSFVTGVEEPTGIAADGRFVYWTSYSQGRIGRARKDGTRVHQAFVAGASGPMSMTVVGSYLYWARIGTNTVDRALYDGSGADQSFAVLSGHSYGVAANAIHTAVTHSEGADGASMNRRTRSAPATVSWPPIALSGAGCHRRTADEPTTRARRLR